MRMKRDSIDYRRAKHLLKIRKKDSQREKFSIEVVERLVD